MASDRPRKVGGSLLLDDGTTWTDPREGHEEIDDLIASLPDGPLKFRLRGHVSAYRHLAWHPAGTESAVRSLRSLRRAMRATEVVQPSNPAATSTSTIAADCDDVEVSDAKP